VKTPPRIAGDSTQRSLFGDGRPAEVLPLQRKILLTARSCPSALLPGEQKILSEDYGSDRGRLAEAESALGKCQGSLPILKGEIPVGDKRNRAYWPITTTIGRSSRRGSYRAINPASRDRRETDEALQDMLPSAFSACLKVQPFCAI